MRHLLAAALAAALAMPSAAAADNVTDQIDQAAAAYRKKDLSAAVASLEAAATLIRQQKLEIWKTALPAPLPGWSAAEPQGESLSPVLFGGATNVSRAYRKGAAELNVSITADSPVVQAIAGFLSSGISGFIADGQLLVIDGRRVLYSKAQNYYQTVVGDRVLVKIDGNHDTDDGALRQYLKAVKFDAIEKLAK